MGTQGDAPGWRRRGPGEPRWPGALAVVAIIGIQLVLPRQYTAGVRWVLPALEVVLIGVLVAADPGRMERRVPVLRRLGLVLIGVVSFGTAWSVGLLVLRISTGHDTGSAAELLASGAGIWVANVLTFAVWFWEMDRGGPVERAFGSDPYPDLLFPQMTTPELVPANWKPAFADYLYVAFTNSTAFSPTDTLPLSRPMKVAMLAQSVISLVTVALVVAKAVGALG